MRQQQPASRFGLRLFQSGTLAASISLSVALCYATPQLVAATGAPSLSVTKLQSVAQRSDSIGFGGEDQRPLIAEELRKAGIAVEEGRPAFALGATLDEMNCESDETLRCSVTIRWELKERRTGRIVYRVTTRGRAEGSDGNALRPQLMKAALQSLLKRDKFVKTLQQGSSETAVSNRDAGFRECPSSDLTMPAGSQAIISATVLVESGDSMGSGSIVSPDGYVLTAAHVIEPDAPLHVQLSSGPVMEATLIRQDLRRDVALLQVKGTSFKACLPLSNEPIGVGEEVFAVGSPLSKELSFSLTRGIVSGFRTIEGVPLVQTDASVNPGNSGGPLVDTKGRLIAVVDFKISGQVVQGLAFAVTTQAALESLHLHSAASTDHASLVPLSSAEVKQATASVDDLSDPAQPGDTVEPPKRKSATAATMQAIGGSAIVLGLTGVGTTWLIYEVGKSDMRQSTFNSLTTYNTIGWVTAGLGASMVGLSFLVGDGSSSKPKHTKRPIARVYGGIGPASLFVGGEL